MSAIRNLRWGKSLAFTLTRRDIVSPVTPSLKIVSAMVVKIKLLNQGVDIKPLVHGEPLLLNRSHFIV